MDTRSRTSRHQEQSKPQRTRGIQDDPFIACLPKLTTRSKGYPTPITYRGLFTGSLDAHCATTLQNASFSSPPARPPMA